MTAAILADEYRRASRVEGSDIAAHFPRFFQIVAACRPRTILELGVRNGDSTVAWLMALAHVSSGELWSVDIAPCPLPQFAGWRFILGDDLDPAVSAQLPASIDVLFIDTSHAYEHTLSELALYGPRVRRGGFIVCHDTENEHPEEHGEPIPPQEPFPVKRALDEWCAQHGQHWTNDPQSWGLGVVEIV